MSLGEDMRDLNKVIKIDQADGQDANFIFNSWLKSFEPFRQKYCSNEYISKDAYYRGMHSIIINIILKNNVLVVRDITDDNKNSILGYIVCGFKERVVNGVKIDGNNTIHYIYVKQPYRGFGIASRLIAEGVDVNKEISVSCITASGKKLLLANKLTFKIDPYKQF